ncbi:metallophosphoesterase family protein [Frigidibacter sp. MR17.24]|uniref:metallophosphoesterase family protein n=1 Tax=Frigidibacter sp. MR17.24 TaxID=3127345 RepID=UPI0030131345
MTRLLHLSDLHFGRTRPELLAPLIQAARDLAPDATIVSGDLTQRAREWQFEEAANLMASLPQPVLVVPGNHDVPLDRPLQRFLRPFALYREEISADLEPMLDLPGMRVIGMNTADPFAWERGKVRRRSLALAVQRLSEAPEGTLKVVVMHHPLYHPPGATKEPMPKADWAAKALADAGADLVLAGHLHAWGAAAEEMREGRRTMLLVQAGTGTSTRLRGQENDFNVIDLVAPHPSHLRVTRWIATEAGPGYAEGPHSEFVEDPAGWRRID